MTNWLFGVIFGMMFGTTMLALGVRLGRQQALRALAKSIDAGTFRVQKADGSGAASHELLQSIDASNAGSGKATSKPLIAIALVVACAAALMAFLLISSTATH
jgi:hypothetical protein